MPRIAKVKEVTRIQVEKNVESVSCDFCGRKTNDHGTEPGIVDWPDGEMTVCWAMEEGEEAEEIIICPECFVELKRLIPKIKVLM